MKKELEDSIIRSKLSSLEAKALSRSVRPPTKDELDRLSELDKKKEPSVNKNLPTASQVHVNRPSGSDDGSVWEVVLEDGSKHYFQDEEAARKFSENNDAASIDRVERPRGISIVKDMTTDLLDEGIQIEGTVAKLDDEKQLVFGWASVVEENGEPVTDLQGDQIDESEMEKMAYSFVVDSRVGGVMHKRDGERPIQVAKLVESIAFTKDKQEALGVDLGKVGWWVGFKVNDDKVWEQIKKGNYSGFSIHGRGRRKLIED